MNVKLIAAVAAGLLSAVPAFADPVTLDFEGAPSFASVDNFYGGGAGTNVGVLFGGDALAFVNDELGPYFSNAPTPGTIMAPVGADAAMNVLAGFTGTASLFYSSTAATTVSIFSGLNGTGDLLGTFELAANAQNGCLDSPRCHWDFASLAFAGTAQSIQFGSAWSADPEIGTLAAFDNISVAPVPLPAAVWLLLSGLGGLTTLVRRRQLA
ncbi:MAG TPA: VPLPA-CTERM sorting domain-containing protein [Povalibacter sp.]|nr:VPLPA-CTERM sorting domain-containing protein [Povalibacter sp.]